MPRRILFSLLTVLLCLLPALCLAADKDKMPQPALPETPPRGAYIADYANIVNDADREAIAAVCRPLQTQTGSLFICLTEDALEGMPLSLYSDEIRKAWALGERDCLLVFMRRGRRLNIANGTELAARLTREQLDATVAPALPELKAGNLSAALRIICENMALTIAKAYGMEASPAAPETPAVEGTAPEAPVESAPVSVEEAVEEE